MPEGTGVGEIGLRLMVALVAFICMGLGIWQLESQRSGI
jgi:cytochrome oxidase assembly protein ShyY1